IYPLSLHDALPISTVEQEPPKPARVSSAFVEHNIKYHQFRSSLEIRSSIEGICNKQLLCAGTVQKRICRIVRITVKIHLRHETVIFSGHLEMDVCRSN